MTTRRKLRLTAAITSCLAVAVMLLVMSGALNAIAMTAGVVHDLHYFNDDVNADDIGTNNFNFGPDRYDWATAAVEDGTVADVLSYIITPEGEGDLLRSINRDPALCAAIALDMDERLNFDEKILVDEQDALIGQRADKAHLHFLSDSEYWDRAVSLIKERLTLGEMKIVRVTNYKSSMYQYPKRLQNNKPSVVVRTSSNAGGHVLVVDLGPKIGIVKYRLECGYQPIDVDYWPTPDEPSIPDNPEPQEPEPDQPEPDQPEPDKPEPDKPEPDQPEPDKPEPDKPEPDQPEPDQPELQPKDPDAGPQGQDPTNPDFGGEPNHDPDKTVTEEPQSPDSYTPPDPPQAADDEEPDGGDSYQPPQAPENTASSGSPTVDRDNGTTEKHNGEEYHVVAGDGETHTDLEVVREEQHDDTTVEPPLQNDPPAAEEIAAPE